jgi:benzaldehyde dehydrogenase (NAD)
VAKGARLLAGGTSVGRFYAAVVLDGVVPGNWAVEEEIFGPVACVVRFETDDEAVALASKSEFGLAARVISGSVERAHVVGAHLFVGHLHINDQTSVASPFAPFGGRGRSGNGSRISAPAIWEEFTQWVWISAKAEAAAYPF